MLSIHPIKPETLALSETAVDVMLVLILLEKCKGGRTYARGRGRGHGFDGISTGGGGRSGGAGAIDDELRREVDHRGIGVGDDLDGVGGAGDAVCGGGGVGEGAVVEDGCYNFLCQRNMFFRNTRSEEGTDRR